MKIFTDMVAHSQDGGDKHCLVVGARVGCCGLRWCWHCSLFVAKRSQYKKFVVLVRWIASQGLAMTAEGKTAIRQRPRMDESFLLLFFKKEALASLVAFPAFSPDPVPPPPRLIPCRCHTNPIYRQPMDMSLTTKTAPVRRMAPKPGTESVRIGKSPIPVILQQPGTLPPAARRKILVEAVRRVTAASVHHGD